MGREQPSLRDAGQSRAVHARAAVRPVPAVRADAAFSFPLRDGAVAGLFMGELIEHIYGTGRLLAECHRVLRAGGCLVLTTPNLAALAGSLMAGAIKR